jgi:hypothetical protein
MIKFYFFPNHYPEFSIDSSDVNEKSADKNPDEKKESSMQVWIPPVEKVITDKKKVKNFSLLKLKVKDSHLFKTIKVFCNQVNAIKIEGTPNYSKLFNLHGVHSLRKPVLKEKVVDDVIIEDNQNHTSLNIITTLAESEISDYKIEFSIVPAGELPLFLTSDLKDEQKIINMDNLMTQESFDKNFEVDELQNEIDRLKEEQKDEVDSVMTNQIDEKEKVLTELYNNLPLGPSFLHKKDIEKLNRLIQISDEPIYENLEGKKFYQPQISQLELSDFFLQYALKMGCSGISINMQTNSYYTIKTKGMFTSVTFSKSKNSYKNLWGAFETSSTNYNDEYKELIKLINSQLKKWGFCKLHSNLLEKNKQLKSLIEKNPSMQNYSYYFLLYHTPVPENDKN